MNKKISVFLTTAIVFFSGLDLFASALTPEASKAAQALIQELRSQKTPDDVIRQQLEKQFGKGAGEELNSAPTRDEDLPPPAHAETDPAAAQAAAAPDRDIDFAGRESLNGINPEPGTVYIPATQEQVGQFADFFQRNPNVGLELDVNGAGPFLLKKSDLPDGLRVLRITNKTKNLTHIGTAFLAECDNLIRLDLSGLSNVIKINEFFLYKCTGLTQLDLSPLSKVTEIAADFLSGCTGLPQLDLRPLSKVTEIGGSFLSGCTGLPQLDLSPLSKVTEIGGNFLSGCTGLTQLDLTPLSKVTQIGNNFLTGCRGLTLLNLSGLSKVTLIGNNFLYITNLNYDMLILPLDLRADSALLAAIVNRFPGQQGG